MITPIFHGRLAQVSKIKWSKLLKKTRQREVEVVNIMIPGQRGLL